MRLISQHPALAITCKQAQSKNMRRIFLPLLCITVLVFTSAAQSPTAQNASASTAAANATNSSGQSAAPAAAKSKKSQKEDFDDSGSLLGNPPVYTPPPSKEKMKPAEVPAWLNELVVKQFGKEFEIFPNDHQVLFTGDLDGDGIEDAVIVVRSEHPLLGASSHNFVPLSPEEDYYGWGKASTFAGSQTVRWEEQRILLIIHGSGPQAWRSETPKAKFVMVNLPFEKIQLTVAKIKKRTEAVISGDSMTFSATIFWDGKKYKFDPTGTID